MNAAQKLLGELFAGRVFRDVKSSRSAPKAPIRTGMGIKEQVRHAGKPDGPMHGLPPLFRSAA